MSQWEITGKKEMKKIYIFLCLIVMACVNIYADIYDSCKVSTIPGAYIYATAEYRNNNIHVNIDAHGVNSGGVDVSVTWTYVETKNYIKTTKTRTDNLYIPFSNGKGHKQYNVSAPEIKITNVRVSNPVCK